MITREADYAMRVVLALSRGWKASGVQYMSVGVIAGGMGIPYRFLRKIAGRMAEKGLVVSRRGKSGGLRLARAPGKISLLDIVNAMAPESVDLSACVNDPAICGRSDVCPIGKALGDVQRDLQDRLRNATFDRLSACELCDPS